MDLGEHEEGVVWGEGDPAEKAMQHSLPSRKVIQNAQSNCTRTKSRIIADHLQGLERFKHNRLARWEAGLLVAGHR